MYTGNHRESSAKQGWRGAVIFGNIWQEVLGMFYYTQGDHNKNIS